MKARGGRMSAAEKMALNAAKLADEAPRVSLASLPEPPVTLTGDQARVWREIVATKPVGWFSVASQPLLVQYCRAITLADDLDKQIAALMKRKNFTPQVRKSMDALHNMSHRNSVLINRLATSMRLTQQSQYNPRKAGTIQRDADAAGGGSDAGAGGALWDRES